MIHTCPPKRSPADCTLPAQPPSHSTEDVATHTTRWAVRIAAAVALCMRPCTQLPVLPPNVVTSLPTAPKTPTNGQRCPNPTSHTLNAGSLRTRHNNHTRPK